MKLTLYYMFHAVKNQIRKLFRTWVAIFLLVCVLLGVIIGLGGVALSSLFEEDLPEDPEPVPIEEPEEEPIDPELLANGVELAVGGLVLGVLILSVLTADKSGGSIFQMADVNILFPAPLSPQSVLTFRLVTQAGTYIVLTLYLCFQIPNLIVNLGLSIRTALVLLAAWFFLLVYQNLISVFLYTFSSAHPRFKKNLRTGLYLLLGAALAGYLATAFSKGNDYLGAAFSFFNSPVSRAIPVWGWFKLLAYGTLRDNPAALFGGAGALLAGAVLLIVVIRHIKADFYEDAMARSAETASIREAAQQGKRAQRKKERNEKLKRDGLRHGWGASVYFHKAMYNRLRFSRWFILTKTSVTYLVVTVGLSALMIFAVGEVFFPVLPLVLSGFVFFRSFGNPIAEDVSNELFPLVPDSSHRKVFFSFAAGALNSALDLLPSFLLGAILLRADVREIPVWFLLILSFGTYSDSVGMFIDLSLPGGISQTVRSVIQILFVYFGLLPAAVLIIVGFALDQLLLFSLLAICMNVGITAISLAVSPLFLDRGRR